MEMYFSCRRRNEIIKKRLSTQSAEKPIYASIKILYGCIKQASSQRQGYGTVSTIGDSEMLIGFARPSSHEY
jgi:hypothetical protein